MVNSSQIPSSYTSQWKAGDRQPSVSVRSGSGSDREGFSAPEPRYCSSCSNCRRSRVKCSGGHPCQRCAKSSDPSSCVYKVSQRHGKRKANNQDPGSSRSQTSAISSSYQQSPSLRFPSLPSSLSDFEDMPLHLEHHFPHTAMSIDDNGNELMLNSFAEQPPCSTDLLALAKASSLGHFQDGDDINTSTTFGLAVSCNCYLSNQTWAKLIDSSAKDPEKASLDNILQSLRESSAHIVNYLACPHCDNGCPRLVNLAMLHQRQVGLMCTITKNPAAFLHGPANGAVRFTLGVYQLNEQDDCNFKRLAVLSAARSVESQVTNFDDIIRGHQDAEFMGTSASEISESAKLNLRWLLDVARNLRSRLRVIISMLEKQEWGLP
ncbi:hypothetical protein PT974_02123 [Cladobotryum mycophilum]|uniref:Zn(2)-C6 fungal-type domain-containing protein n=1 Tax=Cladobotryum mycophilum TaxID=491253 RepID=A0ABR0SYF4_9HYPO